MQGVAPREAWHPQGPPHPSTPPRATTFRMAPTPPSCPPRHRWVDVYVGSPFDGELRVYLSQCSCQRLGATIGRLQPPKAALFAFFPCQPVEPITLLRGSVEILGIGILAGI